MVGRRIRLTSSSAARRRSAARTDGQQSELVFVTLLQSVLCVMMLTAAFVISNLMGMTDVKTAFYTLITKETEAVEVFSPVKSLKSSEKISRLKGIIELILSQAAGSPRIDAANADAPAGQGGQLLFLPQTQTALPDGVTDIEPLLSAPMARPVKGVISSHFGMRSHPITNEPDFHTGVDFAAPLRTPIGAAWPGAVIETGESKIYGRFVTLDHGGYQTRYCHCSEVLVRVGMRLRQRETLALVGNTGMSTGPHLHFELIINGKAANPLAERGLWQPL